MQRLKNKDIYLKAWKQREAAFSWQTWILSLLSQCRCMFVFFIFHVGQSVCACVRECMYVCVCAHYSMLVATVTRTPTSLRHCFRQPSHKKSFFSSHSSLDPLIYLCNPCLKMEVHWTFSAFAYTTLSVCMCVCAYFICACTLYVCMLPWLQAWRHHFKTTFAASKER